MRKVGMEVYVDPKTGVTTWGLGNGVVLSDGSPFISF